MLAIQLRTFDLAAPFMHDPIRCIQLVRKWRTRGAPTRKTIRIIQDSIDALCYHDLSEQQMFYLYYVKALVSLWTLNSCLSISVKHYSVVSHTINFNRYVDFVESSLGFITLSQDPLEHAMELADRTGLWLEFGVASGTSLEKLARMNYPNLVYGFDSFLGLPEAWKGFEAGHFSSNGKVPNMQSTNVEFICGLFEDTVAGFLFMQTNYISLVHIDCDLYKSTKTVLNAIGKSCLGLNGFICVFDELVNYRGFECHEFLALFEFLVEFNFKCTWIGIEKKGCLPVSCRLEPIK